MSGLQDLMTPQNLNTAVDLAHKFLGDKPVLGSLTTAAKHLSDAHNLVFNASGGKIDVLAHATEFVQSKAPAFGKAVSTHVSAAKEMLTQDNALGKIADQLKGHLNAGVEAVRDGAKTALAMAPAKGNSIG